jgi:hypothetical protein
MTARQTSIQLGLAAAVLLLANVSYFSRGIHRQFTWLYVCLDAIFIVCVVVAFFTTDRRR